MTESDQNPFEVLGVSADADDRAIRQNYARLIREVRSAGDTDAIQRVQTAFEAIRDAESRARLQVQDANSDVYQARLAEAAEAIEADRYTEAEGIFRKLVEEAPKHEPSLQAYFGFLMFRGKFDRAARIARHLAKTAPTNASYYRVAAEALMCSAQEQSSEDTAKETGLLAMKHLRRAKELGDDSVQAVILESRILLGLGRVQLASSQLKKRLEICEELRSDDLEIAMELLRLQGSRAGGRAFSDAIDVIGARVPEDETRRRTVALALVGVAKEFESRGMLARAIDCVELAEICRSSDPDIRIYAASLRGGAEDFAEDVEEDRIVLPVHEEDEERSGFFDRWRGIIVPLIAFKIILACVKTCHLSSNETPSRERDSRGREVEWNSAAEREALWRRLDARESDSSYRP